MRCEWRARVWEAERHARGGSRRRVATWQALDYCHGEPVAGFKVFHRDLKPDNIGLTVDGRMVLFDFGLSKLWKSSCPQDDNEVRKLTGQTGSTRYMSPEVTLDRPYNDKAEVCICRRATEPLRVLRPGIFL